MIFETQTFDCKLIILSLSTLEPVDLKTMKSNSKRDEIYSFDGNGLYGLSRGDLMQYRCKQSKLKYSVQVKLIYQRIDLENDFV